MYRELIISAIIIVAIVTLNYTLQGNTDKKVNEVNEQIAITREELVKEDIDYKVALEKANVMFDKWEEADDILAYYLEHNEIEKVTTALTSVKSLVEMEDNVQAVDNLDRCKYILEHIDEKEKFTLDNIF